MFTILLFIFLLFGCESSKQKAQEKIAHIEAENHILRVAIEKKDIKLKEAKLELKTAKKELLNLIQKEGKKPQNSTLSKIGISIDKNKIIFDSNKTKHFFENANHSLNEKLKQISKDYEKGIINDNDIGINIDKSHINIDFNKTKNFFDIWDKKIESFLSEVDNLIR